MTNTNKTKHLNIGIYAHVDAGKTTLSEALLFKSGAIRKSGRVDHGDTFLDTYSLERSRGITIFSKQAELSFSAETDVTLLDTPGHADFTAETERTMKVLDAAILIISAADGVTSQVMLLWKLLTYYEVPVFIFVNKMDQSGADKEQVYAQIRNKLSQHILNFDADINDEEFQEELAVCDDDLLSEYLESGRHLTDEDITGLVSERKLFPCIFGSALRMEGIDELIKLIDTYGSEPVYGTEFGARVYKISRDSTGNRMTWMKITGGHLCPRDLILEEKVDQVRVYSGEKFELLQDAPAGRIVAVTGLTKTRAGQGIGALEGVTSEILQPILSAKILLPNGDDPFTVYNNLLTLTEEEPLLSVQKSDETGDISVQIMGQVQMEVLKHISRERFGVEIDFGPETIVYKETIKAPVEGVGHFEPLRHYAEVHLLLSPAEPGSGISFATDCKTDDLSKNWQNLIISSLEAYNIRGVLTGSEITDMKITVIGGRSHPKHTEGGDFREASIRAVRQGLMMAESILLEPVYNYEIEVPSEFVGRVLSDVQRMSGTSNPPELSESGSTVITGTVPASEFSDYSRELISYTHGQGHVSLSLRDYEPCHNAEEIIAAKDYDPDHDLAQPTGSVFCSHGSGTLIPWNQVRDYMHVETFWSPDDDSKDAPNLNAAETDLSLYGDQLQSFRSGDIRNKENAQSYEERARAYDATIQELDQIFERTYGKVKPRYDAKADEERKRKAANKAPEKKYKARTEYSPDNSYLLVDGYNIIHSNPELKALADKDIKAARDTLMDILSNFQGYRRENVILVFDAYRVPGGTEHVVKYHNLDVVFTKEAETADQYIERTAHEYSKKSRVTVATSDAIEQIIIYGAGAIRMSAGDFWLEVKRTEAEIREKL